MTNLIDKISFFQTNHVSIQDKSVILQAYQKTEEKKCRRKLPKHH